MVKSKEYSKGIGTAVNALPYLQETRATRELITSLLIDLMKNLDPYKRPDIHISLRRALDKLTNDGSRIN
jgi:hypothetical protein